MYSAPRTALSCLYLHSKSVRFCFLKKKCHVQFTIFQHFFLLNSVYHEEFPNVLNILPQHHFALLHYVPFFLNKYLPQVGFSGGQTLRQNSYKNVF